MNIKIYVAAKSELRDVAAACAEMLRNRGFDVVSTWHDDERFDFTEELFRSPGATLATTEATRDTIQILNCDVLVHLLPAITDPLRFNTTGGSFFELGLACGLGKRCIAVGEPVCVFHHLPGIVRVNTPMELCEAVIA